MVGGQGEITWRPTRKLRNFHLFLGGKLGVNGFVTLKDGKLEGGFKAPDLEVEGGLKLVFGNGK